jgi:hypothetical protein
LCIIGGGHPTHRQLGKLRNHANGTLLRRGSCSISLAVEILFRTSIDDFCLAIGLGVIDLGFGFRILCGLSTVRSLYVSYFHYILELCLRHKHRAQWKSESAREETDGNLHNQTVLLNGNIYLGAHLLWSLNLMQNQILFSPLGCRRGTKFGSIWYSNK